jgi:hypothetical protein
MSTFRGAPAPRPPLAAGALVAPAAAAGALVAAAAGALVAADAGGLVAAAPAGLAVAADVGADRFGADDEHALINEASTPPDRPTARRVMSVRLVKPSGGGLTIT